MLNLTKNEISSAYINVFAETLKVFLASKLSVIVFILPINVNLNGDKFG